MPRFSIITPVHLWNKERVDQFIRCYNSLKKQTFKDFEWIVVNDGSTEDFLWSRIKDIAKVYKQPHLERVVAYNTGFEKMTGEWIIFLDSDDELDRKALEKLDKVIKANPNYKMFNFGAKYVHKDKKITVRDPFQPKILEIGHEVFGGGNIVNGTFIFKRSVWEDLGGFPPENNENQDCTEINYGGVRNLNMCSPYDFSAKAQLEFPELRQFYLVNHEAEPNKIIKELGNPWGQDYYLFYKYTRKYHTKPLKEYLYIVHPR